MTVELINIVKINLLGPFNRGFYYLNTNVEAGDFVEVEFGRQKIHGICTEAFATTEDKLEVKIEKLKPVGEIVYKNICSEQFLKFLSQVAEYNMLQFGNVLEIALPAILTKQVKERKKAEIIEENIAPPEILLNNEQQIAVDLISQNIDKFKAFLINGVTGSGKTQVYIAAMFKILFELINDSQVLILMPEISLTPAVSDGIKKRFGLEIGRWHSSMTPAQKRATLKGLIDGSIRVIVGARSAVFLPYKNLKMIIVDEEHDHSYKQDETPVYHGRDMAVLRASVQGIPIILASATPSVESYNHALKKKYEMIVLKQRFGDAKMPKMEIIDLNIVRRIKGGLLSEIARKELMDTIKSGNQAMIFLNRRGYAKMVRCDKCDFVFGCSNCTNKLTFHKKINMLKCHYCDFSMLKPNDCPQCHTPDSLSDFIPGVEQLKEEVEEFCGGLAKVSVFSSDEITGKDGIIKKIAEIQSQEFNVIIGTQIVSKGHNFPNLALVIVVGVDAVSNQNDPRIFEKLYQLLIQVAGRAGRTKNIEGKVLLQTMSPKHEVLQAIMEGDQDKFYAEEITRRKQSLLPPFLRQVNMIISAEADDIAKHNARTVSQALRLLLKTEKYNSKIGIAGPSESLIPYLKRKYRYTILLDSEKISLIRSLIREALETLKIPAKVQVKIDIDPYNFS